MKSKIWTILLSAVIAFGLWLYVVTVEHTQIEMTFHNIPVVLDGKTVLKDRGLMTTSDNLTISMKLYGNRTTLNSLKSSDIIVTVDLNQIHEAGTKKMSYEAHVPGDIEIVSRPESIEVVVVEWDTKEIEIQHDVTGTPEVNYIIDTDNITCQPETATISGPKEVLDKIAIGIVPVDMTGKTESFEGRVKLVLCDANGKDVDASGVTVETASQVLVKVPVLLRREVSLSVKLLYDQVLTAENTSITLSFDKATAIEEITIIGNPAVVSKITNPIVLAEIDLSKVSEGFKNQKYDIPLPEGVECEQGESVFVTLDIPEVETFTLDIPAGQIQTEGLPVGYEAQCNWGDDFTLTLRKLKNASVSVTPGDIQLTVLVNGQTISDHYAYKVVTNKNGVGAAAAQDEPMEIYVTIRSKQV